MAFIRALSLHHFRNYSDASVTGLESGFVVLTGVNGAGKTNVLEAISLLTPGRGLRGAKTGELRQRDAAAGTQWSVASTIESPVGPVKIGTGGRLVEEGRPERRIVRVNGVDLKTQADLADYLSCVWLTPQMDGLFLGGASERRRFFDRLVYAFDPAHAGRVTRYESVMTQRARLLRAQAEDGVRADPVWLSSLEAQMAEAGVAIAAARLQTLQSLDAHMAGILEGSGFPAAHLALDGGIEHKLQECAALAVEDEMRAELAQARGADAYGSASIGPHRTDLVVTYHDRSMPAAQCSTGEQKALLTGIVLAHAVRTRDLRDAAPVLLFDEIAAHFDEGRRAALFSILGGLGAQVFITGTDAPIFGALQARRLHVGHDQLRDLV